MWPQRDALLPGLSRRQCPQAVVAARSALPGRAVFLMSQLPVAKGHCSLENLFVAMAPLP